MARFTRRAIIGGGIVASTAAHARVVRFAGGGHATALPLITGITPMSATIIGGTGSAGEPVATITVTVSVGSFSGSLALGGADASHFTLTGAALAVGGSDITPGGGTGVSGAYALTLTASGSYTNSPQTFSFSVNVLSPGTSLSMVTGETFGSYAWGPYTNQDYAGLDFTVGASNVSVIAIGRWDIPALPGTDGNGHPWTANAATHNLVILDQQSFLPTSPVVQITCTGSNQFIYATFATPVTLVAGRRYFLVSTEDQGGPEVVYYPGGAAAYTHTADFTFNGSIYQQGTVSGGNRSWHQDFTGNTMFGPVNLKYTLTTALASIAGTPMAVFGRNDKNLVNLNAVAGSVPSQNGGSGRVVSGTITIDTPNMGQGPVLNSSIGQWWIDGAPASPYITGPGNQTFPPVNFPWALDTTTLSNGSHAVHFQFVDIVDPPDGGRTQQGRYISDLQTLIVNNSGNPATIAANVAQKLWSGHVGIGYPTSHMPDWVMYPGTLERFVNGFDYPMPNTPPAHIGGSPNSANPFVSGALPGGMAALRNSANYYLLSIGQWRLKEYEFDFTVATMPPDSLGGGGVTISSFNSVMGLTAEGAHPAIECTYTWDGLRYDSRISPYSTFICDPPSKWQTQGWIGIEKIGRVVHLDMNGQTQSVAGVTLDRANKLAYQFDAGLNLAQSNFPAAQVPYKTLGTNTGFSQWSGINDLCYDTANSNIIYVCNASTHIIVKIDTTGYSGIGTSNPTCTRIAGQEVINEGTGSANSGLNFALFAGGGYSGDGGPATSARLNEPWSLIMGSDGILYIADKYNQCIRYIDTRGILGTAGNIYTLVGNQTNRPPIVGVQQASATCSITGTTLTVNSGLSGTIAIGHVVLINGSSNNGVPDNTHIVSGGGSSWVLSASAPSAISNQPVQFWTAGICAPTNSDNGYVGGTFITWTPPPSAGGVAFTAGNSSAPMTTGPYINFPNTIKFASGPTDFTHARIVLYTTCDRYVRLIDMGARTVTTMYVPTPQLPPGPNVPVWTSALGLARSYPDTFGWMDVDYNGSNGPIDDLLIIDSGTYLSGRFSFDGTYGAQFIGNGAAFTLPNTVVDTDGGLLEGPANGNYVYGAIGGYTWIGAFHTAQCMYLAGGTTSVGVNVGRCNLVGDADYTAAGVIDETNYTLGYLQWTQGSPLPFPRNCRPSFVNIHGYNGFGHLGSDIAPTTHDIAVMYNGGMGSYNAGSTVPISSMVWSAGSCTITLTGSNNAFVSTGGTMLGGYVMISGATNSGGGGNTIVNGFFKVTTFTNTQSFVVAMPAGGGIGTIGGTPLLNYGDGVLCAYVQSGAGGNTFRQEWDPSGNDWRALSYFIRRSTTAGTFPPHPSPPVVPALIGPANPDLVAPVILTCTAVRNTSYPSPSTPGGGISITVSWTTNKPCVGVALCTSTANFNNPAFFPWTPTYEPGANTPLQYGNWSFPSGTWNPHDPIGGPNSAFATSGSAAINWCPTSSPLHFTVVVKDRSGNTSYAQDQTLT